MVACCSVSNRAQGPEYWLNVRAGADKCEVRALALADAFMWGLVCSYAPGASGLVLNPF